MKINLRQLRHLIREALLLEAKCPGCGTEGAYIGMNDVECPNRGCKFFSQRQKDEASNKPVTRDFSGAIDRDLTTNELTKQVADFMKSLGLSNLNIDRIHSLPQIEIRCDEGDRIGTSVVLLGNEDGFHVSGVSVRDRDSESPRIKTWERLRDELDSQGLFSM